MHVYICVRLLYNTWECSNICQRLFEMVCVLNTVFSQKQNERFEKCFNGFSRIQKNVFI